MYFPLVLETKKVRVPLLLQYAGLDTRINAGVPEFVQNLIQNDKEFTIHHYSKEFNIGGG